MYFSQKTIVSDKIGFKSECIYTISAKESILFILFY